MLRRRIWLILLFATSIAVAVILDDPVEDKGTVAVRTWAVDDDQAPLPELDDPEIAVPWLADRPSFGIAFSGGGTRSASASLGQFRALHQLGWLRMARYLSSNSGGSWVTVPYTYLPLAIDETRFLGEYLLPEDLTDENLQHEYVDPLAFSTAIHDANTFDQLLEIGRGDEAYSDIVASIFLEPFGLHDNEKFFTFHRAALDSALAGNPWLTTNDFQVVEREDRPFLIVTGVMLGEQMSADPSEHFPLEMTPLYTGVRARNQFEKDDEIIVVGGGYVESFGYDSYEPESDTLNERWHVRISGSLMRGDRPGDDRYRFTLSDVIGASSAAPLATLSRHSVPNFLFPEFRHWPIDRAAIDSAGEDVRRRSDEFQHGDGADMDNLSITSLLVRKTENIVSFVNSATSFQQPDAGCANVTDDHITDDIISLFRPTGLLIHNVMFAEGDSGLEALCESFAEKQAAGEPLVHCQAYDVIENDWYRSEPYRANVCWVYLDKVGGWMDRLNRDGGEIVQDLRTGEGSFDSFPHYATFAEHGISLIDLNRERVVALSNLAAWTVKERAQYMADSLPDAGLPVTSQ